MSLNGLISVVIFFYFLFNTEVTTYDIKDYDAKEFIFLLKSLGEYRPNDVTKKDVKFYLYTRKIENLEIPLHDQEGINVTKITKFITHGFMDNHNRSWYHDMTSEFLKRGDFNIVQVDWGRVALSFYFSSAHNAQLVGFYLADFILNHKLDVKKVHLIGHSLGAHISAFAAQRIRKRTGSTVKRITALDPAGPGFWKFAVTEKERLSKNDADIVDVIHTDGGFFGIYSRLGTFDIYVNGGMRIQPECRNNLSKVNSIGELFEDTYCSHKQSYLRFIEMINDRKFTCKKCESWLNFVLLLCQNHSTYTFGAEDIDKEIKGACFINTTNDNKNK